VKRKLKKLLLLLLLLKHLLLLRHLLKLLHLQLHQLTLLHLLLSNLSFTTLLEKSRPSGRLFAFPLFDLSARISPTNQGESGPWRRS
jgi:hypothetical protein